MTIISFTGLTENILTGRYYLVVNRVLMRLEVVLLAGKLTLSVTMWTCILLVFPYSSFGGEMEESGCSSYARQWIQHLGQSSKRAILIRNTRSDCEFSAKWIKKNSAINNEQIWKRTCNDLVLIWTHKKCIYYRDYIDYNAYVPCKEWTRQMYNHCIDHDISWFHE